MTGTQWRVTVKAGTYDRFDVPLRTKNITIMGESREGTVVRVLQEEDESFWGTGYDSGGITLRGTNITLKNLTIQAGTRQMNGFTAAGRCPRRKCRRQSLFPYDRKLYADGQRQRRCIPF